MEKSKSEKEGGSGGYGGGGGEDMKGLQGGELLRREEVLENLAKLREWLLAKGHAGIILLSTDEYLTEYIPLYKNDRYHASGFSGSTGDMLITLAGNYIYVDGRYTLQAKKEAVFGVLVREGGGMGLLDEDIEGFLKEVCSDGIKRGTAPRILIDGRKQSKRGYDRLSGVVESFGGILDSESFSRFRFVNSLKDKGEWWGGGRGDEGAVEVLESETHQTKISYKLNKLRAKMSEHNLDYVVLSAIDELSYIYNLRSYAQGIYSSSARGISMVGKEGAYIFLEGISEDVKEGLVGREGINVNKLLEYKSFIEKEFLKGVEVEEEGKAKRVIRVGYDGRMLSKSRYEELHRSCNSRVELVDSGSLMSHMRSIKGGEELEIMEDGFARADLVMEDAIKYIKEGIKRGEELTEERVYNKIEEFFKIRGARGLSFSPIVASGENSAYVHYTRPDRDKRIEEGELMLLDIGGYWEGGYATDLTRTFQVGGLPKKEYKDIYTIVLKASIQLLSLTYPVGTKGYELNNLGQGILWSYGYSCPHGLGHGIGLNVHESPPVLGGSIGASGGGYKIEDGMVFTIEPGIYIEGVGGVRIENVVQAQHVDKKDGWLCMRLLTHAKLDGNLIDKSYLTAKELDWLNRNYALS